jgi:hypothetical protein
MPNEDFQKQVLQELKKLSSDISDLKSDVKDLNHKADVSYEQIAGLLEFRTETIDILKDIKEELKFLAHKEQENEKDLFKIKNKLKIS